jgi:hypothetical protein
LDKIVISLRKIEYSAVDGHLNLFNNAGPDVCQFAMLNIALLMDWHLDLLNDPGTDICQCAIFDISRLTTFIVFLLYIHKCGLITLHVLQCLLSIVGFNAVNFISVDQSSLHSDTFQNKNFNPIIIFIKQNTLFDNWLKD